MPKQLLHPDEYAKLNLPDQFIEDIMQEYEAERLLTKIPHGSSVLDLGWGSGIVAKALCVNGRDITVVDGSAEYAEQARKLGIKFCLSMFEDFKPDRVYDIVIASFVLEHVQDPISLLMRMRDWANQLVVVVGNAGSYHRQLAVAMGLQERLDSLSERDKAVGHYRVYDYTTITNDLKKTGWKITTTNGLMFKPLPNRMLAQYDPALIRAMCEILCPISCSANLMIWAEK